MGDVAKFDAIVIGAGFGGSACAALLAKRGLEVLLLDKNVKAGGKAMSLSKRGFRYTAWVVITAPDEGNPFEKVLRELKLEGKVELARPTGGGGRFKNSAGVWTDPPEGGFADPNKLLEHLEVPESERAAGLAVLAELATLSREQIAALDDLSFAEWLRQHEVPRGIYAQLVSPMTDGCFVVPADALSASEALETLQNIFLHPGVLFCKGGMGKLAEAFAYGVEAYGGRVLMHTPVERIRVAAGTVRGVVTPRGEFEAPIVISNAGIQPTVLKLVGEEHFDLGYVNYVKELVPSWGFMGARYFLDAPVIDDAFGTLFSAQSPWSLEKCRRARRGELPDDMCVWFEVPSNYDPEAAPRGKQLVLTGHYGPADPKLPAKERKKWWALGEKILFEAFPELRAHIESTERYSAKEISAISREHVLPGQGGETIGLGQIVGQDGRSKPAVKAPIGGLFYVGCDAGGRGIGTQQATDSGIQVADLVHRYFLMHDGIR